MTTLPELRKKAGPEPEIDIVRRISNYLGNGGLFNPELMNHDKVRELLIECRDELVQASIRVLNAQLDAFKAKQQTLALLDRIKELEDNYTAVNRIANDRQYMLNAVIGMLGPLGKKMWGIWQSKGVCCVHHDWGPKAPEGEERAAFLLNLENRLDEAKTLKFNDSNGIAPTPAREGEAV